MQDNLSYNLVDLLNGLLGNKFLAVRTSMAALLQRDLVHANSWQSMSKCLTMITLCTTRLAEVIEIGFPFRNWFAILQFLICAAQFQTHIKLESLYLLVKVLIAHHIQSRKDFYIYLEHETFHLQLFHQSPFMMEVPSPWRLVDQSTLLALGEVFSMMSLCPGIHTS